MGGGVAMLLPTDTGRQMVPPPADAAQAVADAASAGVTRLTVALRALQQLTLPSGTQPFARLAPIAYSINVTGTTYTPLAVTAS